MFAKMLSDVDTESLKVAIARHLAESETPWFPAIGLLRRYANENRNGIIPDWESVWGRIMEAVSHWSQHDRQRALEAREMLGEEIMPYVKMLGGFYSLANCSSDGLNVKQSNFRNAWTKQKADTETLQKTPEELRPKQRISKQVQKNLESFGSF